MTRRNYSRDLMKSAAPIPQLQSMKNNVEKNGQSIVQETDARGGMRMIGIPYPTLGNMHNHGTGPKFYRVDDTMKGRIRFRVDDVQAWMERDREKCGDKGHQPSNRPITAICRAEYKPGRAAPSLSVRGPAPQPADQLAAQRSIPQAWRAR